MVTVVNKHVTAAVGVYAQQMVFSVAVVASLVCLARLRRESLQLAEVGGRERTLAVGAGLLYLGASTFMLLSYQYIPASIGFTIIQLNTIWTFAIGLFVFHEFDVRRDHKRILLGLCLAILGSVSLVVARL